MSEADGDERMDRRTFLRNATAGTAGTAIAVGAAGTAAGQEGTSGSGGGSNASSGGGGGGGGTKTVEVGPGGNYVFKPEELTVAPGTTVEWSWKSDNHNIVVTSQPEGAGWEGTAGSKSKTYDTGHTYSHTFNTNGTFEYHCEPHKNLGMKASVVVQAGGASSGGGESEPPIPKQAVNIGVAATTTMLSTLGLAYVFMKYGGDYSDEDV